MMSASPARRGQPLTEHEVQILMAVAHGLMDTEIAARLYCSPHTIKTHLRRMHVKLGANGRRPNLVARGFACGYLRLTAESVDTPQSGGAR